MPLFRRSLPTSAEVTQKPPKTILAAAIDVAQNPVSWKVREGEDRWQKDAWYFYDAIGELRYATNWIANAISLADMYAAEIDPETGLETGPTENTQVQMIAESMFGGSSKRAQAQSTMALNWIIAGEVFVLIRSNGPREDEWLVLSSTEVSERGGKFSYCDPATGAKIELNPQKDMLLRIWNPHPRYQSHADSSVRASLPILKEIERTSMNIASRLDSRLSGAGVWIIPKELDFAGGDGDPDGAQGVMDSLVRAARASLSNPGDASAQVPIVLEAPGEQVSNFNYQTFSTELTAEVLELRTAGIRRLALSLDMPPELLTGMSDANHWSAWQIEETAYKIHVAPPLDRFRDALTVQYFRLALASAGVSNPERYMLAFNTTEINTRPNRHSELIELYDRLLISDDAVRSESGISDDEIPPVDEYTRRFAEKLVLQDTSLLADPGVRRALGFDELSNGGSSVSQSIETQSDSVTRSDRTLPERVSQSDEGLVAAAELMVWDALSRAGGRLLTREHRGQHGSTPKHELHTIIRGRSTAELLEGSFQFVESVAPTFGVDPDVLTRRLNVYCTDLILEQRTHDREELRRWLSL